MKCLVVALLITFAVMFPRGAGAIPQPPHDQATHGVTCADCHAPYGSLNDPVAASGSASVGSGELALVDAGKSWAPGEWVGGVVTIQSGASQGQFRAIIANDATSLSWEAPLPFPLAGGDQYRIGKTTEYDIETRCTSCHNPTGQASGMSDVGLHVVRGGRVVGCGKCHDPHNVEANSGVGDALIRRAPRWPTVRGLITFPAANPANAFVAGASAFDGICEGCHTETSHHRNNTSGDHSHNATVACTLCHSHKDRFAPSGCDGCHQAPPPTGAHLAHYAGSADAAAYGSTAGAPAGAGGYAFNCGSCHPLEMGHHANGVNNSGGGRAEVDLSPSGAPAGSLKARNPSTATYSPGATLLTDARGFSYTAGT
jgi:hypothetical protein